MTALRLGWTLAVRGGRSALVRAVAMGAGFVAAGFVAAALIALPAIFDGRNQRMLAQGWQDDASSPLRVQRWEEEVAGRSLTRVVLNGSGVSLSGVDFVPGPDELVWSPALADLAAADPLVSQRFPQRVVGVIDDVGLAEPEQLVVYVGVTEVQASTFSHVRPGAIEGAPVTGSKEVLAVVAGAATFLMLPAAAFLATSARLSGRAREERLASLRLLGLRARTVRAVNAVETGVVAAIGSLIGALAWVTSQEQLGRFGVGGFHWFAADAPLDAGALTAIVAGSSIAAVTIATVVANGAIDAPLATRRATTSNVRIVWRALVLAFGITLLVICAARRSTDRTSLLLFLAAGACSLLGVTLATPVVSGALGRMVRPAGPTRLVVSRRLRYEPLAAGRIMTGVLVATFTLGIAQGVIGAFRDVEVRRENGSLRALSTTLPAADVLALPGVESAIPRVDDVWIATCAQLRAVLHQALPSCVDGERSELVMGWPAQPGARAVEVDFAPGESSMITGIVEPPPADGAIAGATSWFVRLDGAQGAQMESTLVARDPAAFAGNWSNLNELGTMVIAVVIAGAVVSFSLGFGAVVLAIADRSIERQRLDTNLLAVGVPARLLRHAQFATSTLPVGITVVLAAVLGALTGHIYRDGGIDDEVLPFPWTAIGVSTAVGIAGAMLAGSIAWALTRTHITASHLRSE
jgi:hypothetical protein